MRVVTILTIFSMLVANIKAQSYFESYPIFDRHLEQAQKPMFEDKSVITQFIISTDSLDTLNAMINMQIFEFADRYILFGYHDNRTLKYKIETKMLNDSVVIKTYEDVDEESVFKQITKNEYNCRNRLLRSRIQTFEFDTLYRETLLECQYENDSVLTLKRSFQNNKLIQKDSLVYNNTKLSEVHIVNYKENYYKYKIYSYSHSSNVLDEIKTFNSDSRLIGKITFPEANKYRHAGEIIVKSYKDPITSRFYSVETKKYTTSVHPNHIELVIDVFYDHEHVSKQLRKFDMLNRIIEKQIIMLPGQEKKFRKYIFKYDIE